MKKTNSVIIWKDADGGEHAYLIDKKNGIIPESFVFWMKNRRDVKEVKLLNIEPIRDEHSTAIIRSLEPLPAAVSELLQAMKTEHGWIYSE